MATLTGSSGGRPWEIDYTYDPTGITITRIWCASSTNGAKWGTIWPVNASPYVCIDSLYYYDGISITEEKATIWGVESYYIYGTWNGSVKVNGKFKVKFYCYFFSDGVNLTDPGGTLSVTCPYKSITVSTDKTLTNKLQLNNGDGAVSVKNTSAVNDGSWTYTYTSSLKIGDTFYASGSDENLSRTLSIGLNAIKEKKSFGSAIVSVFWNGNYLTSASCLFYINYCDDISVTTNTSDTDRLQVNGTNALSVSNTTGGTAGFRYKTIIKCGNDQESKEDGPIPRSFTIPNSWLENASSTGTAIVECYYEETLIKSSSETWYLEPAAGVADIENISFSVTPVQIDGPENWPVWVQNHTKTHTESDATIAYGTLSFSVTVGNLTQTGKSLDWTTVTRAETYNCILVVTDSWGRTQTRETSFLVQEYNSPAIESVKAYRINADGTENEKGTSVFASARTVYSDCAGWNVPTLVVRMKLTSDAEYGDPISVPVGGSRIIEDLVPDADRSYNIVFIFADAFNTVEYYFQVLTGDYFMYFKRGGRGVAVGKAAEYDRLFDIGYDARVRGDLILDGGIEIHKVDGTTVTLDQILDKLGL